MKKTLNQITALSDEVWYHLDVQHPIFLLSIFLCISGVGAKSALGGVNPESDIEFRGRPGPLRRPRPSPYVGLAALLLRSPDEFFSSIVDIPA